MKHPYHPQHLIPGTLPTGKTFVFRARWDGLGDNLLWSPVPEMAKKSGFSRVYFDESAGYRDPNIKKLVWESNPYLDGFYIPKKSNPLELPPARVIDPYDERQYPDQSMMFGHGGSFSIQDWGLRLLGFTGGGHKAVIYNINLPVVQEVVGKTVLDPNFCTGDYCGDARSHESFKDKARQWVLMHKIDVQLHCSKYNTAFFQGIGETLRCNDLMKYASIIKSCDKFICVLSGGHDLAIALGKRPVVLLWKRANKSSFNKYADYVWLND